MSLDAANFTRWWRVAADDLGLEIEAPYTCRLSEDTLVEIPVLLRSFGARRGMLLLTDYSVIRGHTEALVRMGYGYSILSEPTTSEPYSCHDMIDLLRDWGWADRPALKPTWL